MSQELSHINGDGKAKMVDIGHKVAQLRTAKATGKIQLGPQTIALIQQNNIQKGDVLAIAGLRVYRAQN